MILYLQTEGIFEIKSLSQWIRFWRRFWILVDQNVGLFLFDMNTLRRKFHYFIIRLLNKYFVSFWWRWWWLSWRKGWMAIISGRYGAMRIQNRFGKHFNGKRSEKGWEGRWWRRNTFFLFGWGARVVVEFKRGFISNVHNLMACLSIIIQIIHLHHISFRISNTLWARSWNFSHLFFMTSPILLWSPGLTLQ